MSGTPAVTRDRPLWNGLKKSIRRVVGDERWTELHQIAKGLAVWPKRKDLCALAEHYGSDKWGVHRYAAHYQNHFERRRRERLTILEIGVGGYANPRYGGGSLRMWKAFFPRAKVFAIDIHDKSALNEDRIRIFQGSQDDTAFLESVVGQTGPLDIIIDDGSHMNAHVLASFEFLFPHLRSGGHYVIEDLQTSYWPAFGGTEDPTATHTGIALCKRLLDGLNWEECWERPVGRFDHEITAVHMYHNLGIIEKGVNVEGSNKEEVPINREFRIRAADSTPVAVSETTSSRPDSTI